MTKVSIEEINGKQCTVIRKPFDAEWVKEQLSMGNYVRVETFNMEWERVVSQDFITNTNLKYILTILPALPKHPKPEDAPLLHRYMAEGLEICGISVHSWDGGKRKLKENSNSRILRNFFDNTLDKITHATHKGERVEIAILKSGDE